MVILPTTGILLLLGVPANHVVSAWRNLPSWPAGVPGTSLHVPDPAPHNESSELMSARQFFMGRQAAMLCFHNMLSLHTWS